MSQVRPCPILPSKPDPSRARRDEHLPANAMATAKRVARERASTMRSCGRVPILRPTPIDLVARSHTTAHSKRDKDECGALGLHPLGLNSALDPQAHGRRSECCRSARRPAWHVTRQTPLQRNPLSTQQFYTTCNRLSAPRRNWGVFSQEGGANHETTDARGQCDGASSSLERANYGGHPSQRRRGILLGPQAPEHLCRGLRFVASRSARPSCERIPISCPG